MIYAPLMTCVTLSCDSIVDVDTGHSIVDVGHSIVYDKHLFADSRHPLIDGMRHLQNFRSGHPSFLEGQLV
jgi:hypothetical protein